VPVTMQQDWNRYNLRGRNGQRHPSRKRRRSRSLQPFRRLDTPG
jgi:hypothetical protein